MRLVMTGATSGIGLAAARRLLGAPDADLVVGARDPDSAPAEFRGRAELRDLDLARLASVRAFAASLAGEAPIDRLILNAGCQSMHGQRSLDGFELTFAVNHLAHYLLVRLVAPRMARKRHRLHRQRDPRSRREDRHAAPPTRRRRQAGPPGDRPGSRRKRRQGGTPGL